MKIHLLKLLLSGLAAYLPLSLPGATNTWIGGNGDWSVATNWSTGSLPGPDDVVVIGSGPAITVTHSLTSADTVAEIQCQQTLVLPNGSITVTSNTSQFTGSLIISNGAVLGVSGAGTTLSCNGSIDADDGNFSVAGGAVMTLPTLKSYSKDCYGANWIVTGTNSELNLPALTNITGQACGYPVIQAEAGGQSLMPNVVDIEAGPMTFQADGANSLIKLTGLTNCAGQDGYFLNFEASAGGSMEISNLVNAPLVSLSFTGQTNSFPALTNFTDGNITLNGGAAVTLPAMLNFTKTCYGGFWAVTGTNSVLNCPGLTNITGESCNFPIMEAESGGQILLTNVGVIELGPLTLQADGSNSLVDLRKLTNSMGMGGYPVVFEASAGGTMRITNLMNAPLTSLSFTGAAVNLPVLTNFTDGNFTVSGGAVVTLPELKDYTKTCYGDNWTVTGSNSVLNLPALTNISGEACNYPVIQAENGGQILMANVSGILEGPVAFQADGTNSVINLSGLTSGVGEQGYLLTFEASDGGTLEIPNFIGSSSVTVTINPGGAVPTTQMRILNTLNLLGATANLNNLTNVINLTVTGVTMNFPVLSNFDDGNVTLSGGAVVTMPVLQDYTKLSGSGDNWSVTGPGSILNLPALTNLSGLTANYPVIQAEAGGEILLTNLASILLGPLTFQADGADSLINLSGLKTVSGANGYLLTFEASNGGTIVMPNMVGGPLVAVALNPGGTLPTSQIQMLNTLNLPGVTGNFNALTNLLNLTVSGVAINFPALSNFDDGNVTVSSGAVVTMPALKNYTKLSCSGDNWTVTGSGSVLDLPALTNMTGYTCNFPVIQAEAGGEILATNLANVQVGPLAFNVDGTNSLIDLRALKTASGSNNYLLTFEASTGGTLLVSNLASGQLVGLTFNPGGYLAATNLTNLIQGSITVPGGTISLPVLRDMDATSLNVTGGAVLTLSGVGDYSGGNYYGAAWLASGAGSVISLPGLTNLIGGGSIYYPVQISAEAGGEVLLTNLGAIANGSIAFLADGAGSAINLTSLSGFVLQNGQGSITAQNGGTILLNNQAFLLANVSINVPAGNPVLPPALIASSALTLYGQAWHSYMVEERNTLITNSPFKLLAYVPMTNAFQAIASVPPPNTAYLVTEFVANPPLLDLSKASGQVQLTLYGLTNGTYQIQSTTNLSSGAIVWTNNGSSITMTNAFRILPPASAAQKMLYYRAKEL